MAVASVAVVALLVGTSLMFILNGDEDTARIRIDGDFSDWNGVAMAADDNDAAPNVDITDFGVVSDSLYLSFYIETAEPLFAGELGRTARILIDTDLDVETGFAFNGLGADYLVELYGSKGYVLSAVFYTFEADNAYDWNGFTALTTITARLSGNMIETQVPLFDANLESSDVVAVVFQTAQGDEYIDTSDFIISNKKTPLVVELSRDEVTLTAPIGEVYVDSLTFKLTSTARANDLESAKLGSVSGLLSGDTITFANFDTSIESGQSVSFDLTLDAREASAALAVGLEASSVVSDGLTSFVGSIEPYYIGSDQPTAIVIDGAFGDWADVDRTIDTDETPVTNPAVDLVEQAAVNTDDTTYFYLQVEGDQILNGIAIPAAEAKSKPGSGSGSSIPTEPQGPVDIPELTGEDAIYIFIDTDGNDATGYEVYDIGADIMVELKGVMGDITRADKQLFTGDSQTEWKWSSLSGVDAAATGSELELAVDGVSTSDQVYIHLVSWDDAEDWGETQVKIEDSRDPIPEFSTIAIPVAGMMLIFGYVRRRREE